MRTLRFRLALVLAATAAFGGCAPHSHQGGLPLDREQTGALTREIDQQLNRVLTEMIASTEVGPESDIFYNRPLSDERFMDPRSGLYWQISGGGQDLRSRSLFDRTLEVSGRKAWIEPLYYNSDQFPNEPLRIAERSVRLPGSNVEWQFVVARARDGSQPVV